MDYAEIPNWLAAVFIVGGLLALAWSSDAFVDGAATLARWLGISPFIVGMVIVGFGTCAPEFFVSIFSGASGHASLSMGNAYGSCIFNIVGILGIAALVAPLVVRPIHAMVGSVLLMLISVISYLMLRRDHMLQTEDAWLLLVIFLLVMPFYCWLNQKFKAPADASKAETAAAEPSKLKVFFNLVVGFVVMVAASHFLVWGSVDTARALGVSELVIGLTVVAIGTSLPELAAAVASARKGQSEMVLGNIVGSNLFNVLCVVGAAGVVSGEGIKGFSDYVFQRDIPVMFAVSLLLGVFGINWSHPRENGSISRLEGFVWVMAFVVYTVVMVCQEVFKHG